MTKIDIFSGFLGAGKTTLIKKLIAEAFQGEQIVLIENEFGEIGIDGGFLKEAGIQITEMNSGCICCSLVGDFRAALKKVVVIKRQSFETFQTYLVVCVLYFILTFTVTRLLRFVERKLDGNDSYVIFGSQSDSAAEIRIKTAREG